MTTAAHMHGPLKPERSSSAQHDMLAHRPGKRCRIRENEQSIPTLSPRVAAVSWLGPSFFRGNTSVLVRIAKGRSEEGSHDDGHRTHDGGGGEVDGDQQAEVRVQHVQIDTGKTWREGVIRWFPR